MRWQSPSERTQLILLSPIIAPMAVLVIPVAATMWAWERWGPEAKWRPWFAWRPVRAEEFCGRRYIATRWVWLERIERYSGVFTSAGYRFPEQPHKPPHSADGHGPTRSTPGVVGPFNHEGQSK